LAAPEPQPETPDPLLLTLLGLDAEQDAVYRRLVDHPDSAPAALMPPGTGEDATRRTLDALVDRGLVAVVRDETGERYRASPPILTLGPLLESRRAALHRVEHLLTDLAERHRTAQSRAAVAPVEVLSGAAAIRRRLVSMERGARHEIRAMVPAMPSAPASTSQDTLDVAELELMRRGVTVRTVVERSLLEDSSSARSLADVAAQGQWISVVDDLPLKLLIADRDLALLSLDPEGYQAGEPVALVVHRGGLLTVLIALFEQYFANGWRLQPGGRVQGEDGREAGVHAPEDGEHEPGGSGQDGGGRAPSAGPLDAVDRKIVALLHVGLTDAAIARQLGMGHRTVQRRLQRLMESVGAATRFQLGWHAATSGWLDRAAATRS
jgi:DNA-binding CsgD family transcriptional regulator